MNTKEIEFKFLIKKQDIPLLKKHPLIKNHLTQKKKKESLKTIYFDTPKKKLRRKGYMLRIRQSKNKIIQTLKRDCVGKACSANGLHQHMEWEYELSKPVYDITLLPPDIKNQIKPLSSNLQPIFTSKIDRQTWLLTFEDTHIELVLDQGAIIAGKHKAPIYELELELKEGAPKTLKSVAKQLQRDLNLIPESKTKSARGYSLLKKHKT